MHVKKWHFSIRLISLICAIPLSYYAIPANANTNTTTRYLDPAINEITVDQNACFKAAPKALLEISPYTSQGARLYKIEQVFNTKEQKILYTIPLKDQVKNRKFIAKKFCYGLASLSDMDLPMVKSKGIQDENDGMLLLGETRRQVAAVLSHLNEMKNIAVQAASGTNGSLDLMALNVKYQSALNKIDDVAMYAQFEGIHLLDGNNESIKVPVKKGSANENISLINLRINEKGLNLSNTDVLTSTHAFFAINSLSQPIYDVTNKLGQLQIVNDDLKLAAKTSANITIVDLRTEQFSISAFYKE